MSSAQETTLPTLDILGPGFHADPHGMLRAAREQGPFAMTAMGTALLRYDEVQEALGLRALRSPGADFLAMQGVTSGPLVDEMRGFLLSSDGEAHDRVRRVVGRAFTKGRVEALRPLIHSIANELVDRMAARRDHDFMADFADPFAFRVLCAFVGIPESAHGVVHGWGADVGLIFGMSVAAQSERIQSAFDSLHGFTDELAAERRRAPGDDLISALVAAEEGGEKLTTTELRSMLITLISAGHGTVMHQLGNAVATFLDYPEQWRLLANRPELAGKAAEEVVRFCPASLLGLPRIAKEDLEIGGRRFEKGSFLLPITGSANRDAKVFESADRLDITLERTTHLTFGGGIHYCLGAALGRAELEIALPLLARRLPDIHAAGAAEWLPPTEAVYGPLKLPIATGPASPGA